MSEHINQTDEGEDDLSSLVGEFTADFNKLNSGEFYKKHPLLLVSVLLYAIWKRLDK